MLTVKNISKRYKMGEEYVIALDKVSLSIRKSEMVAIVGASGSGKSTLMHILGCLDHPDSGHYFLEGKEISKMNKDELAKIRTNKIGFVRIRICRIFN